MHILEYTHLLHVSTCMQWCSKMLGDRVGWLSQDCQGYEVIPALCAENFLIYFSAR